MSDEFKQWLLEYNEQTVQMLTTLRDVLADYEASQKTLLKILNETFSK